MHCVSSTVVSMRATAKNLTAKIRCDAEVLTVVPVAVCCCVLLLCFTVMHNTETLVYHSCQLTTPSLGGRQMSYCSTSSDAM
jgi:hypothetical protein